MVPGRVVPDDPLQFIQQCIKGRKIEWTYHVNMRLKGRFISRKTIIESVDKFEIIEAYPEDKYLPSYLIYSQHKNLGFHILFAIDVLGDNIRIVTAYYPNPEEWDENLKKRSRYL
jgi:hypothetical protein